MNKKQENFNREANLFFRTDEREYNFGRRAEIEVKPILEKFLSIPLLDTKKYDKFDFIGENIKIELKRFSKTMLIYAMQIIYFSILLILAI